jgi:hypothetical protein
LVQRACCPGTAFAAKRLDDGTRRMFRSANAIFLLIILILIGAPAWAHHSFAAEFDSSAPVVLEGKVTKVEWMNPHVYICVDVADDQGRVTNWTVESVAPNYLMRLGWTRKTLRVGDMVVIRAFSAKGQTKSQSKGQTDVQKSYAKSDTITLPDGRSVTTGHALDTATGTAR